MGHRQDEMGQAERAGELAIPEAAVEAAFHEMPDRGVYVTRDDVRAILEAAAPHMLAEPGVNECRHVFVRRPYWWMHRKSWMRWVCHCGFTTRAYDAVDRMGMRPIHPHVSVAVPGYNTWKQVPAWLTK